MLLTLGHFCCAAPTEAHLAGDALYHARITHWCLRANDRAAGRMTAGAGARGEPRQGAFQLPGQASCHMRGRPRWSRRWTSTGNPDGSQMGSSFIAWTSAASRAWYRAQVAARSLTRQLKCTLAGALHALLRLPIMLLDERRRAVDFARKHQCGDARVIKRIAGEMRLVAALRDEIAKGRAYRIATFRASRACAARQNPQWS